MGATGVLALDYTRSTGFHRVEIDGHAFWFATEDHNLRIQGITRMPSDLQRLGTGWSGHIFGRQWLLGPPRRLRLDVPWV